MTELEIDQSHLPRVQEVCQCFAVLEDGALAHNLQEQEIEQYYTTNIQKNQLVQNDIRIAKRLQDEEEELRARQRALLSQATRQLEEQDSEYARMIQEEIQRCGEEEARRREQEDEEIAKRIQEEEEQRLRQRSSGRESLSDESASDPASPSPRQRTLPSPRHTGGQHHPSTASRRQCSTSHTHSDSTEPWADSPSTTENQNNRMSRSNNRRAASFRQIRNDLSEPAYLSDESEETDAVVPAQLLTSRGFRLEKRLNTAPSGHQAPLHHSRHSNYRGHQGSFRERRDSEGDRGDRGDREETRGDQEGVGRGRGETGERQRGWDHGWEQDGWCGSGSSYDREMRSQGVRERLRSSSDVASRQEGDEVRDMDRDRDRGRSWTYREEPDRHVRFQEQSRHCHSYHGDRSSRVWRMLGQVLQERGVAVRFQGGSLRVGGQARDSLVHDGSDFSQSDNQSQQRAFQRATPSRRSYHGDGRERRRLSPRDERARGCEGDRVWQPDNQTVEDDHGTEVFEGDIRDAGLISREGGGSRRWRRGDPGSRGSSGRHEEREEGRRLPNERRVRRCVSERWHGHKEEQAQEETHGSEEEQESREERPPRRATRCSRSFCSPQASPRARAGRRGAGAGLQSQGACLDLGELQQVLRDEELARRLQEVEERQMRRIPQPVPSPHSSYPEGDFRVAQVAQDEEIARFMQKQEMKSKRRSSEMDNPGSWRDPREMAHPHDRRPPRGRQRERLDSEGLPSPSEDCSPDLPPASPTSTGLEVSAAAASHGRADTLQQAHPIRNIAEELDPTFKARRRSKDALRLGPAISGPPVCQSPSVPQSGLHDFLEEPTFIPPTKRHSDKSGRIKLKEKKENCKQQ